MDNNPSYIPPYYDLEDELTLKDIIESSRAYLHHFWDNKFWILLLALIGFLAAFVLTKMSPVTYTSAISFVVDESSSEGVAIETANLGEMSLKEEKLVTLSKSDKIVRDILFDEVTIGGRNDLLVNHICEIYGLEGEAGNSIQFNNAEINSLEEDELAALGIVQGLIAGNPLKSADGLMKIDVDRSKLISMSVTSVNAELSQTLVDKLYNALRDFYIDQTVGRVRGTRELLVEREKDILNDLGAAEEELNREIAKAERNAVSESQKLTDMLQKLEDADRIIALNNEEKRRAIAKAQTDFQIRKAELDFELSIVKAQLAKSKVELEKVEKNAFKLKTKEALEAELTIERLKNELELSNIDRSFAQSNLSIFSKFDELKRIPQYNGIQLELARLNKELSLSRNVINNAISTVERKLDSEEDISFLEDLSVLESDMNSKRIKMNSLLNQLNGAIDSVKNAEPFLAYDMSKVISETREFLDREMNKSDDLSNKIIDLNFDRLSRKVKDTYSAYQDILKNKQLIDLQLKTLTPEFAIISKTYRPEINKMSLMTNLILGAFLGLFLGIFAFSFHKLVKDAL